MMIKRMIWSMRMHTNRRFRLSYEVNYCYCYLPFSSSFGFSAFLSRCICVFWTRGTFYV